MERVGTGHHWRERTFFEKVGYFFLAELAHIRNIAIVPQECQYVVSQNIRVGVRSTSARMQG